jgi:hypothetical protein
VVAFDDVGLGVQRDDFVVPDGKTKGVDLLAGGCSKVDEASHEPDVGWLLVGELQTRAAPSRRAISSFDRISCEA